MAAKKYYGVKVGRTPGIYLSWDECKKQVMGYPGALYKSFPTEAEAEEYISGNLPEKAVSTGQESLTSKQYDIYVDGGYRNQKYSWAFVVYDGPQVIHEDCGTGENPAAAVIHNVAGELEATVKAIQWAEKEGITPVVIHHDYIGISEWATGKWKTNNQFTQAYAGFVRPYLGWVRFNKVTGHAGVAGNERADKLAGEALNR